MDVINALAQQDLGFFRSLRETRLLKLRWCAPVPLPWSR